MPDLPRGPHQPIRWRVAAQAPAERFEWDGEAVLLNPLSWQTHLLNEGARALLEAIEDGPRDEAELVAMFADEGESPRAEEVRRALAELESLGFIVRDA